MTALVEDLIEQISDYIKYQGTEPKIIYVNDKFYYRLFSDFDAHRHLRIPFTGGPMTFQGIELRRNNDVSSPDFVIH